MTFFVSTLITEFSCCLLVTYYCYYYEHYIKENYRNEITENLVPMLIFDLLLSNLGSKFCNCMMFFCQHFQRDLKI